jgi:hypothetical protein
MLGIIKFYLDEVILKKKSNENGCPWDFKTCSHAAENGHLESLTYAHENGCEWDKEWSWSTASRGTCSKAAAGGHLEVLMCMLVSMADSRFGGLTARLLKGTIGSFEISTPQWLLQGGSCKFSRNMPPNMAVHGMRNRMERTPQKNSMRNGMGKPRLK